MKSIQVSLAGICLFFTLGLLTSSAEAQGRTTQYTGFINNDAINLTIVWRNYVGLGEVWGHYTWQGMRYTFTGTNYAPGKLRLFDSAGDEFLLSKRLSGGVIGWRGSSPTWGGTTVTFTRPR